MCYVMCNNKVGKHTEKVSVEKWNCETGRIYFSRHISNFHCFFSAAKLRLCVYLWLEREVDDNILVEQAAS